MVQHLFYQIEAGLEPGLLYKGEVKVFEHNFMWT